MPAAKNPREYWQKLFELIRKLCRYYRDHKDRLPGDLPSQVTALLALLDAACAVLDAYDLTHAGGIIGDETP